MPLKKVVAEELESAEKKLLEAKQEQEAINDDPVKLHAEIEAAKNRSSKGCWNDRSSAVTKVLG